MKLAYQFLNLKGMEKLFEEAIISAKVQRSVTTNPDQIFATLMPSMIHAASNTRMKVELDGKEETVKKLMAKIVDLLGEEGWGLPA